MLAMSDEMTLHSLTIATEYGKACPWLPKIFIDHSGESRNLGKISYPSSGYKTVSIEIIDPMRFFTF